MMYNTELIGYKRNQEVLMPGEEADVSRKFMAVLCARPEIGFEVANGSIKYGSYIFDKTSQELDAELERYYFKTNEVVDSGHIADIVDGKVKVKNKFKMTFGYLQGLEA